MPSGHADDGRTVTAGDADPDGRGGRVALLLGDADRDLVAEELAGPYTVLPPSDGVPDARFDLAVVDERRLEAAADALAARVGESETFLPVLCLLSPETEPPPSLWDRVDDVAVRPLSRRELRARVASLLRTRRLSVETRRRSERLEAVAGVLAHDVRNPLAVASGYVDRATDTGDVDHLAPAADALDRADRIVDDVLALARHGADSLDVTSVDLRAVARTAWAGVETGEATLALRDDLGRVDADESRLLELFENLFRNSAEHGSTCSRTGSGSPLRVTVEPLSDRSGFAVADDGTGVPEDERERVFERGYTTRRQGTGFGLAIVDRIAALHGWSTRLADDSSGARFEFALDGRLDPGD